jgi:integrase
MGTVLAFAVARGLRSDNPSRGVKKPPIRKMERFLSEDEIARLAVALDAESNRTGNPYPAAAIKLLLLTGGRRGEILELKWQHVDFERQCLRLPESKTGPKVMYLNAPAFWRGCRAWRSTRMSSPASAKADRLLGSISSGSISAPQLAFRMCASMTFDIPLLRWTSLVG